MLGLFIKRRLISLPLSTLFKWSTFSFIILLTQLGISNKAFGQHELNIEGAHVTIESGATLHVQGNVHLDEGNASQKGRLNNDGLLEIRGDLVMENTNVEVTNGIAASLPGTSTGIIRMKNRGFSTETSHQTEQQTLESNNSSDFTGLRAIYTLELANDRGGAAANNLVDMDGGNVEIKNELRFVSSSRLRTDNVSSSSTPPSGADLNYSVFVNNTDAGAIVGASTTAGDDSKYIEGKLNWQIEGSRVYTFPIGLQPGYAGIDGMASFDLTTTAAAAQRMDSYLSKGQTNLGIPQIYCDIGEWPNIGGWNNPWSACSGGPDGIYDFAHLNEKASHEWIIENQGSDFNYDLEVFPGPGLDATVPGSGSTCGTGFYIRFLSKDGVLIDNGVTGEVINAPHPFSTVNAFPRGFDLCPPATKTIGNQLDGLSSFSSFRLYGSSDNETVLPVELVYLQADPVNNQYILVQWETASEVNNDGFFLQRSTDAVQFETIHWVDGFGTTSDPHHYQFNDMDVEHGIRYYYRLIQVDFNSTEDVSYIVDARLEPIHISSVDLYPNPVLEQDPILSITSSKPIEANIFMINAIGQEMINTTLEIPAGTTSYQLPLAGFAAGTYIVNVYWEDQIFSEKLINLKNR